MLYPSEFLINTTNSNYYSFGVMTVVVTHLVILRYSATSDAAIIRSIVFRVDRIMTTAATVMPYHLCKAVWVFVCAIASESCHTVLLMYLNISTTKLLHDLYCNKQNWNFKTIYQSKMLNCLYFWLVKWLISSLLFSWPHLSIINILSYNFVLLESKLWPLQRRFKTRKLWGQSSQNQERIEKSQYWPRVTIYVTN